MAAAKVDNHSRGADEFIAICDGYDHFDSVILRPCGGSKREGSKGRSVS